jgi:F-type H+-transporting ATPase subunit b
MEAAVNQHIILAAATSAVQHDEAMIHAETLAEGETVLHHPEPNALGIAPGGWVALAILVLLGVGIWKKVPSILAGGLDKSIAEIKAQLEEARSLRAEAEALRQEYANKIANAEKDAAAMIEHARHEAEAIVIKAEKDTAEVIARREKMAEDKIAATERAAVADLRARAASAATAAAQGLIRANHSADADKVLVDQAIGSI